MRAADFRPKLRQAVIWTVDFAPSPRQLVTLAAGPWARLFSGSPVLLPLDTGLLPPEAPHFVVSSADGQWRLQVGKRRTDIIWQQAAGLPTISEQDFVREISETYRSLFDAIEGGRVARLAYVIHRSAPSARPGAELVEYFVKPELRHAAGPLNRPQDFQLHAHKRYQPSGLPVVNSWIRWMTSVAPPDATAISVEQDLNTLAEEEAQAAYSPARVREFFERATPEAEDILRRYLPDQRHQQS